MAIGVVVGLVAAFALTRLMSSLPLYIGLMLVTAVAAFFIRSPSLPGMPSLRGFTPIHLFIPVVLVNVSLTLFALRTRRFKLHRATMMGLFISGIGIAGALAFAPGRVMHAVVFGE